MKKTTYIIILGISIFYFPSLALSIEPAPRITDREVVERLTKVETKLDSVEKGVQQLREDMNVLREDMKEQIKQLREDMKVQNMQLREDMKAQNMQLRQDMKAQSDRIDLQFNRLSAIFTALVVAMIGFAIWDRRTMIRPFESKVKEVEDKIEGNRAKLHSLLDAFRYLGKTDTRVAEVLRSFNLL